MKRLEVTVRGSVQGVGFRNSTQLRGLRLGLTGRVANNPDGSVRIVAEGPEAKLKKLLDWGWYAPPAKVDTHEHRWSEATGEFSEFESV